jgi:hypothetical protein
MVSNIKLWETYQLANLLLLGNSEKERLRSELGCDILVYSQRAESFFRNSFAVFNSQKEKHYHVKK